MLTRAWRLVAENPAAATHKLDLDGNIALRGSAYVNGDARPGVSGSVSGAAGHVSGSTDRLPQPLVFPDASGADARSANSNANVPGSILNSAGDFSLSGNSSLPLPGGTYYFKSFTVSSGCALDFSGPARVYCWGSVSLSGSCVTNGQQAKNLRTYLCRGPSGELPGSVTLSGSETLYAAIYAPQSDVSVSGQANLYGSVVGRQVNLSGNGEIRYDLTLDADANGPSLVE